MRLPFGMHWIAHYGEHGGLFWIALAASQALTTFECLASYELLLGYFLCYVSDANGKNVAISIYIIHCSYLLDSIDKAALYGGRTTTSRVTNIPGSSKDRI